MRGSIQPTKPATSAPITGHHIQWIGSFSNRSSTPYTALVTHTAAKPTTAPIATKPTSAQPPGCGTAGIGNTGAAP
ncbi:hypothetical protein RLIN73S_07489 [Rhodanobacter lindaniclasticus]